MRKVLLKNLYCIVSMAVCAIGMLLMFSGTSFAATRLPQFDLTTTPQTLNVSSRIQMNFTMEQSGYVTIQCDGNNTISLYHSDDTPIIEKELLSSNTDYSITYPLEAGEYYITLLGRDVEKNYYATISAQFEYSAPVLSKSKKTYYGREDVPYYTKLTVKKAGYVILDTTYHPSYKPPIMYICNSEKRAISQGITYDGINGIGKYAFAVKKGTYYIKAIPQSTASYTLEYQYKSCSDKKGNALKGAVSKKKAKTIKIGKRASGLFLATDKTSQKHWYKIVSKRTRYVVIKVTGNSSLSPTSKNGQRLVYTIKGPYTNMKNDIREVGCSRTYQIKVGPKPTYISVEKKGKTTSGNYKITLKK